VTGGGGGAIDDCPIEGEIGAGGDTWEAESARLLSENTLLTSGGGEGDATMLDGTGTGLLGWGAVLGEGTGMLLGERMGVLLGEGRGVLLGDGDGAGGVALGGGGGEGGGEGVALGGGTSGGGVGCSTLAA
jgi:hypothetical protein